jgi:hypothetical protein
MKKKKKKKSMTVSQRKKFWNHSTPSNPPPPPLQGVGKIQPLKMESTLQEKSELVLVHAEGLNQTDSNEKFHCRHPKKPTVNKEQCQIV